MDIVEKAFRDLYPDRNYNFEAELKYSGKFKAYNGNIRHYPMQKKLKLNISKQWRSIDTEIKMGLIQELLQKTFGGKQQTKYMDYYSIFLQKVHLAVEKTESDPILEEAFIMLNEKFFYGTMEQPNLKWKGNSRSQLGSYEYGSDTINISGVLKGAPEDLLHYVLYHEMLHKKHKFYAKNGKSYHHTSEFRKSEERFGDVKEMERKLSSFLRVKRTKGFFEKLLDF